MKKEISATNKNNSKMINHVNTLFRMLTKIVKLVQNGITETGTEPRCAPRVKRLGCFVSPPPMKALFFLLVLVCIAFARKYDRDSYNAQVELGVSSISTALSYVPLPLNETAIYNYTIPGDSQYGMITHWWLTGNRENILYWLY